MSEKVNNPSHYGGATNVYEVIKVIRAWGLDKSFALGNAIKYIARAGKKDGETLLTDLRKARWYLDNEIAALEATQTSLPFPYMPPRTWSFTFRSYQNATDVHRTTQEADTYEAALALAQKTLPPREQPTSWELIDTRGPWPHGPGHGG